MIRLTKKFIYFFIYSLLLLAFTSCNYDKTVVTLGSEFDNTWSFNSASGYDFDDNLVEIKKGKAQLKALDLKDSGLDFNNGTHAGTYFVNDKISTITKKAGSDFNLKNIFPTKNNNLAGYWRFDGDLLDQSVNLNHGVLENSSELTDNSRWGTGAISFFKC